MPAVLQKVAFYIPKGHLLATKRPPFAMPFVVFRKAYHPQAYEKLPCAIAEHGSCMSIIRCLFCLFLQHLHGCSVSLAHDVDALLHLVQFAAVEVVDSLDTVVNDNRRPAYACRSEIIVTEHGLNSRTRPQQLSHRPLQICPCPCKACRPSCGCLHLSSHQHCQ